VLLFLKINTALSEEQKSIMAEVAAVNETYNLCLSMNDMTVEQRMKYLNIKKNNKKIIKRILTNFFFRILATCSLYKCIVQSLVRGPVDYSRGSVRDIVRDRHVASEQL